MDYLLGTTPFGTEDNSTHMQRRLKKKDDTLLWRWGAGLPGCRIVLDVVAHQFPDKFLLTFHSCQSVRDRSLQLP